MKQDYPKFLYHSSEPARLVTSADEHAELGDGWAESPAAFADVEEIPGGVVTSEPAADIVISGPETSISGPETSSAVDTAVSETDPKATAKATAKATKAAAKAAKAAGTK